MCAKSKQKRAREKVVTNAKKNKKKGGKTIANIGNQQISEVNR